MRGVLVVLAWASALVAPPRPPARRRCRLAAPEKAAEAPAEGLFRGPPELLTVRSEALLVAQAGLVGAATGVAVSGFKLGIDALEQASYGAYVRDAFLALPGGWSDDAAASALVYASVPALGGAAVGLLRAATPGFGDAASRTAPATALSRAAAAVATLGTGNSLGPEGPAVELGEALAARVDGGAGATDRRRRILRAAGGAAGVAAGFSAPIAGVFFALEVAYRDAGGAVLVLPRSAVAATAVASVVAAVVSQDVLQVRLALAAPKYAAGASPLLELPTYLGLGALCGLVALALVEAIAAAEAAWGDDGALGAAVPRDLRPAACGLLVGLAGAACQPVLFNGYATLNTILNDDSPGDAATLVGLLCLKVATTASSVGAGLVGGLFAPSLFLGGVAGGAYGQVVAAALDGLGAAAAAAGLDVDVAVAAPPAYATVGAASVLAAMLRAPLTASMLLFELTRDYDVVLPLVASAGVAALVVELLGPKPERGDRRDAGE